jgi:hypothetical protein
MRILWNLIFLMGIPFVMWQQGTYEKYPELALPLFLMWLGVIGPGLEIPDWHWKWKRLERYRSFAIKRDDNDLLIKIDEELQWVHDWNTPATVGSIKSLLGKYENTTWRRMGKIEDRIAELKKTQVKPHQ